MRTKIKTLNRFAFAGKGTVSGDMALDLLEARELIKEMREFISIGNNHYFDKVNAESILDRTKDYS